jgi:hypothetical protein
MNQMTRRQEAGCRPKVAEGGGREDRGSDDDGKGSVDAGEVRLRREQEGDPGGDDPADERQDRGTGARVAGQASPLERRQGDRRRVDSPPGPELDSAPRECERKVERDGQGERESRISDELGCQHPRPMRRARSGQKARAPRGRDQAEQGGDPIGSLGPAPQVQGRKEESRQ